MRVISGKYRGLVIPMPKSGKIRPTTDRAKEALFSILNSRYYFEEITVLDLFSGSGGISLEFASRGVPEVVAVEMNRKVHKQCVEFALTRNIGEIEFRSDDVFNFLKREHRTFDIIFADPPYNLRRISEIPDLVEANSLLKPGGILVIEHQSNLNWPEGKVLETRSYGQSVFSFFQFDVPLEE